MRQDLFRKEVLEEIDSPEQLAASISVTRPSVYLILATAALMAVVLVTWLFMGSVSDKAMLGGVLSPTQEATSASIPNDGVVRSVFVHAGDYVRQNQNLALVSVDKSYSVLSAPTNGIIIQTKKANDAVKAFEPIVSLITQDSQQMQAVRSLTAFADFKTQRQLRRGMTVQVSPVNLPRERYGFVTGRITDIASYPLLRDQALKQLKMENFMKGIYPEDGSAFIIQIELEADPDNPAELNWSFGKPAEADMSIGTFCNVQVITKKRSMFDFLFEQVNQSINQMLQ